MLISVVCNSSNVTDTLVKEGVSLTPEKQDWNEQDLGIPVVVIQNKPKAKGTTSKAESHGRLKILKKRSESNNSHFLYSTTVIKPHSESVNNIKSYTKALSVTQPVHYWNFF